jgi:peptidoglycan/LPS O-acetylase OafA/YrhL
VISRLHLIGNQFIEDGLIAIAFSSLLIALGQSRGDAANPGYIRLGHLMANSSYTLYLVHLPLLVFINAALIGMQSRWQLSSANVLPALAILFSLGIYAYVIAQFTEEKSTNLREWVEIRLNIIRAD